MVPNSKWDECPSRNSNKRQPGWDNIESVSAKKEKALGQSIHPHSLIP